MAFLLATPGRNQARLAACVRREMPDIDLRLWPKPGAAHEIRFALVWRPPKGLFARLPGLQAVSSLGAGVEELLAIDELDPGIALGRLAGPRLAADMAAYLTGQVVRGWKRLGELEAEQRRARWNPPAATAAPRIGLLGTGAMGRAAARAFQALEMPVTGFSRSGRGPDGITMAPAGRAGLTTLAAGVDVVINLLPLTEQTRGILDAGLFANMTPGSTLINVGRGEHLVEADLIEALDHGRPAHAVLDVFSTEPLPEDHPFWTHPRITVTPHCAAVTADDEAARLAVSSYRRVLRGQPPLGAVDRQRGY